MSPATRVFFTTILARLSVHDSGRDYGESTTLGLLQAITATELCLRAKKKNSRNTKVTQGSQIRDEEDAEDEQDEDL